jgi:type II secretory pathway component GspD/PulD (secretin)
VVISGTNPQDVEDIIKVIKEIERLSTGAQVSIQLVPLQFADATSVANTLSQLYQRVNISPTSNLFLGGARPTTGAPGGFQQLTATPQQAQSSVVLIPLPRFNSILMAAPRARVQDVIRDIRSLDKVTSLQAQVVPFALKRAPAARVAATLTNFYAQRYAVEATTAQQVRITEDDSTNTIFVQAAPADLAEIRNLIQWLDNEPSAAVNELRVIPLVHVLSDELSTILQQAISQSVITSTTTGAPAPTTLPTGGGLPVGGLPGGLPAVGGLPGPGGLRTALGQALGGTGGVPAAPGAAPRPTGPGVSTKTTSIKFRDMQSGFLEDVHITSDPRINALLISAPAKSMDLVLSLIRELDVLPTLRASLKVFSLKNADASTIANMLQQLFLGTGTTSATTPALPSGGTGLPTATAPTAVGATGQGNPILMAGATGPATPLITPRFTVDTRSNSIVVASSPSDLEIITILIDRLDNAEVQVRQNEVYKVHNAAAADLATTLNTYITNSLNIISTAGQLTAFQEFERNVILVPEPVSNQLLISATPKYFPEIMRLVKELDAEPPQVVIQSLVAEVRLSGDEEFGVEIGLQSPVLFQRGIVPLGNFLGPAGVINYLNPNNGVAASVSNGVTVNNSINPTAQPGFLFNNALLGNNPVGNPGIVGFQGLGNLGVGRVSPTQNVGGFVFSAASDSFNLLIRALKTQGRMDILSRPQIMTADNQTATILIGQYVPYITGTTVTTGIVTNNISYRNVGVQLQVTPRISPDGKVLMRVTPEVSDVSNTTVSIGNGTTAVAFDV